MLTFDALLITAQQNNYILGSKQTKFTRNSSLLLAVYSDWGEFILRIYNE